MLDPITYNSSTIHFGPLFESTFQSFLQEEFRDAKKAIITDERVSELWIQDLITNYPELSKAEIIQIPSGESYKTIEVCIQIWEALTDYKFGRKDLIINFGGGVITDLGGFVASTFKRGLTFVNIPTTLLSQVDASIGGKTGVDLGPFKNQIGTFADAQHVFIDDRYLETLPDEELLSGYAEMLKHGLIADKDYWQTLQHFNPSEKEGRLAAIHHSVEIKKQIVSQDHHEGGLRKILNFGHTIGHGIEGYLLAADTPTLHGYAIAQGMIAEAKISEHKGMLSKEESAEIQKALSDRFPKLAIHETDFKDIVLLMYNDKKNEGDTLNFSLLEAIGKCQHDQTANDKEILTAMQALVS